MVFLFSQTEDLEEKNLLQKTCQRELRVSKVSSFDFIWIPVKSMEIFVQVKPGKKAMTSRNSEGLFCKIEMVWLNFNLLSSILKVGDTNLELITNWNYSLCQPILLKIQC